MWKAKDETIKLYVWEKEVNTVKGNEVIFVDWTTMELSEKQQSYMITKEPKDLTQTRDILLKNIVPEVMDIFESYNIRKWDFESILQTIIASYNHTRDVAIWHAFWTFKEWTAPEYFQEDIRVSDMKRIMGK